MRDFSVQPPEFIATFMHRCLFLALSAAAAGDSALARAHADTLLRLGAAELEARRSAGGVDPFRRQHLIEAQMAVGLAIRGERDRAVQLVERAVSQFAMESDAIDGAAQRQYLAMTYMLAGRRADAITTLRGLLAVPSALTPELLRLDPTYRSLRGEPAFQQLVAPRG